MGIKRTQEGHEDEERGKDLAAFSDCVYQLVHHLGGVPQMDKWLVPGAIVLASIVLAMTFRVEVVTTGAVVLLHDRFDGSVTRCHLGAEQSLRCEQPSHP